MGKKGAEPGQLVWVAPRGAGRAESEQGAEPTASQQSCPAVLTSLAAWGLEGGIPPAPSDYLTRLTVLGR